MFNVVLEKFLARVVAFGSALITIFVVSGSVTDPVNAPKLLALGAVAGIVLGCLLSGSILKTIKRNIFLWIAMGSFITLASSSVLASNSPLSQNLYGSYGRNNGFLTYLFLATILLGASSLNANSSFQTITKGLFLAGLINVVYCAWVIAFGDFIGWENPYGNILGTLGNPNFIGAFLGIFISAYLGYGLSENAPRWFKFSMLLVLPVTAYEILESHAIQGRVVGLGGVAVVGFFYIRSKFKKIYLSSYGVLCALVGVLGVLGALQKGPLTSYIYKTSVSLRGQYWLAGWNTGESHPLTGVGMDAFGDWYRRSRDSHALELPGVNTVVNAAHNVPLDMFAFGGWPLFISYLAIMGLGGWALLKSILRTRHYDPILVVLATAWVGYQVQSIISINQIGLAVWGWVLTGTAIAYERSTKNQMPDKAIDNKLKSGSKHESQAIKGFLVSSVIGLIGLLLALPPFVADSQWRAAQTSRTLVALEDTMKPGYFNPQNTMKYLLNIQTLEQSNLNDLAHKYTLEAIQWNPESFELWRVLYVIKNSTDGERADALKNMKFLDPLNSDLATN